jgi:hypothetical protein
MKTHSKKEIRTSFNEAINNVVLAYNIVEPSKKTLKLIEKVNEKLTERINEELKKTQKKIAKAKNGKKAAKVQLG